MKFSKLLGFSILLLSMTHLKAQSDFALADESKLIYQVTNDDKTYSFNVDVKILESGIIFDWMMSSPINKRGYIRLSQNALKKATKYVNQFTEGSKDLDSESSVFLSDHNFNEIAKNGSTIMDMGEGNSGKWKSGGQDNFGFTWMGVDVNPQAYYIMLDDVGVEVRSIVVLADGPYHLILSMDLGWSIRLLEVI